MALRILDRLALGVGVGITQLDDAARSFSDDRAIEYQHGPVRLVAQDSASRFIDSAASYQRGRGIASGCAKPHRVARKLPKRERARIRMRLLRARLMWISFAARVLPILLRRYAPAFIQDAAYRHVPILRLRAKPS
jgi:hypothetical protein